MKMIKKISLPVLFLIAFTACKNNNENTRDIHLLPDSSAYNNNATTDSIQMNNENTTQTKSTYRYHPTEATRHKTVTKTANSGTGTVSNNPSTASTSSTTQSSTTQSTKKKGWSKAAQGAVIGDAENVAGPRLLGKDPWFQALIKLALLVLLVVILLAATKTKKMAGTNLSV